MASKSVSLPWTTVTSALTTDLFVPVSPWTSSAALAEVRGSCEMRARYGNALVVPAYQTANDPRNPDTAIAIPMTGGATGWANAEAVFDPANPIPLTGIDNKTMIRFGFIIKLASGSNGGARVRGKVQVYTA